MDFWYIITNYIFIPVTGFLVFLFKKLQSLELRLTASEARQDQQNKHMDNQFDRMESYMERFDRKLDSIQDYLRK